MPSNKAALLLRAIKKEIEEYEYEVGEQWCVSEFTIDCDADIFWGIVEKAIDRTIDVL
jgi:hypothetical protein